MLFKQLALLAIPTMLSFCFDTALAQAQVGPTIILGGPGGGAINDQCPADYVLTGFNTTRGKDLNSIAAVCQPLVAGRILPSQLGLTTWGKIFLNGSTTDSSAKSSRCGGNGAVEGVIVQTSNVNLVHTLALICRDLATGQRSSTSFVGPFPNSEGGAAREETADCGGGAIAVGLIGRYGSMVDAVGLLCMVTAGAPPAGTPPAKPIKHTARGGPVTGSPPIKALNGDDGDDNAPGSNGGGGNGGASAATDTTIYDQPAGNDVAYLSGGDPVTIVSCNDDNWCQISKPQKGWVWGDDLDR